MHAATPRERAETDSQKFDRMLTFVNGNRPYAKAPENEDVAPSGGLRGREPGRGRFRHHERDRA